MSKARDLAASHAGITALAPNATTLNSVASRSADAKAGTVAFFAQGAAPTGWLTCDGALISRATYAALFAAIGTTYGAGDGTTTFALPDLRGEFVRGADLGRGIDTGRSVGSAQGHAVEAHTHTVLYNSAVNTTTGGSGSRVTNVSQGGSDSATSGPMNAGNSAAETRPRNVALLPCIKT